MATVRLDERRVRTHKPRKSAYDVRDRKLMGFGVRVMPSGAKRYFIHLQYQGRRTWKIIGEAGSIDTDGARDRAKTVMAAIREGSLAQCTALPDIAFETVVLLSVRFDPPSIQENQYLDAPISVQFRRRTTVDPESASSEPRKTDTTPSKKVAGPLRQASPPVGNSGWRSLGHPAIRDPGHRLRSLNATIVHVQGETRRRGDRRTAGRREREAIMTRGDMAGGSNRPAFVLIHGSWHGAWTWSEMTPLLAKAGYASVAIDLPGAGTRTRFPQSFLKRPLDKAAFATETSPVAGVTQEDRTKAAIDAVDHAAGLGNGKVVLVGHSWGGLTISHIAEAVPEKLHALVYLTAFLLPDGMTGGDILGDPSFEPAQLGPLFMADPAETGGLRIDPRSQDPDYVAQAKKAFYHDVSDDYFAAIASMLDCDEVASTAGVPMAISPERYGTVARHYIRLADDNAIPAGAQDRMVELVDASGIGGTTTVHRMSGSHSPFFAQPEALLAVLDKIAS